MIYNNVKNLILQPNLVPFLTEQENHFCLVFLLLFVNLQCAKVDTHVFDAINRCKLVV